MLSCCAALLLAAQPSVAQPVNQDAPLMGAAQVDELVVLDINGSHAALRLLETGVDEVASEMCSTKPVACRYPGLPKPTSGVTLYLLEFATQKLTPFLVNPTAFEGCGARRRCLSHAKAKRRLKRAKAAFARAGLDITKMPQATHTIAWTHKPTEHEPPEPENPETTTADQMVFGISTIEQTLAWGGRKFVLRSTDTRSALEGEVVSEVLEGKKVWYRSRRSYLTRWAGGLTVRFPLAYETPSGLVLLERVLGTGAQAHSSDALTPPIRPSTSTASCPDQPLDMVKAVYARYAGGRPPSLAQITCWSPATQALIDSRRLAFDPVVQGQDYQLTDVRVSARQDGSVQATFVNMDQKLTVIWTFERTDRWRAVDLLHQGKSFVKTLKAQPNQR